MPAVVFTIYVDGKDVTANFEPRLIDMVVTDGVGSKSDTLQLTLDDKDGLVKSPRTGVKIKAVGGYTGNTRDFGEFVVDNVTYEGWPQKVSVSAQSVEAKGKAKEREAKGFPKEEFSTYGKVFEEIAGKINLTLSMASELKNLISPGEYQSDENGLEFLTRLADKIGASVTVKNGRLVVVKSGEGKSAGGSELPSLVIAPGLNIISYSVSHKDSSQYKEVEASYYDREKNEKVTVTESTGMEGPKFVLRAPFSDEDEAKKAAASKAKDLVRAQATANFVINGDPAVMAEIFVVAQGCRSGVDGKWRVNSVTHNFSASGAYTTELECEVPSS